MYCKWCGAKLAKLEAQPYARDSLETLWVCECPAHTDDEPKRTNYWVICHHFSEDEGKQAHNPTDGKPTHEPEDAFVKLAREAING